MPVTNYDPERAPNPREWLALPEQDRIRLVKMYHSGARIKVPGAEAHAMFHAIVENQIAEAHAPTCRTVERLQREGLNRHDAIHAVGLVIAEFMYDAMKGSSAASGDSAQAELDAKVEALNARAWREGR
ncbi:MAG TPA: hypothetical protein VFM98_17525 [Ramlibacter sp.]|nr:hypothetical protein [Ramlibacter sp.]